MLLKSQVIEGFVVSISISNKKIIGESSFLMMIGVVSKVRLIDGAVSVNEKVLEMF